MVGDGAVGLCGVIAAKRLGAEQVIILGRHPDRIALAKAFGATDVVSERGEEAVERVHALTGASIIVVGALALAAIKEFVDSLPLAVALEILLLAVAVGIFVWLR